MKRPRSPKLVLFDIDGTLLHAGGSGYRALERAVIEVLRSERGLSGIRLDGNTDLNAIRQVCERDSLPEPSEETISLFKKTYAAILTDSIRGKGHLKPGIPELLARLSRNGDAVLGLVTGNIREGAAIKLTRFGLEGYFRLGAFGCENAERSFLVGLAMRRACDETGIGFDPVDVALVGDTVNDVNAAIPWGIRCLAVATGSTGIDELRAAGATWALPDLADLSLVTSFLLSDAPPPGLPT